MKVGEHTYLVCYKLATAFLENPAGSRLCGKFSEKLHRNAPSVTFLINQSPHTLLFSYTLRAAAREVRVFMGPAGSPLVPGATGVPSIIIMVEAVPGS